MSKAAGPLLMMALLTLSAVPAAGQRQEVVSLRFDGAAAFDSADLASAIETAATSCGLFCLWGREPAYTDWATLEADAFRLKVYYYERGYREAVVEPDTLSAGDGVEVVFRIREGRPVRVDRVELIGRPEVVEAVDADLPLARGAPFDFVAYESARDSLLGRLRDSGYASGQVLLGYTIRREEPYLATIQYRIIPGRRMRFGAISIEGSDQASPELIRRMLTFEAGDRYSRGELLRSQRNLYGLHIFRHASVEAELAAVTDTLVPVRIRVAEGDTRRVRAGAGLNNIECGTAEGRWTSRNFLGDGRRLSVTGRLGNLFIEDCGFLVDERYTSYTDLTGVVSVDFTQPWFFSPRNNIGAGTFAERRNMPEVFVRTAAGGYLSVGRSLGDGMALSLAYRPEITELDTHGGGNLFFCVNFVGCTLEAAVLQEPHLLSPLALSFSMDRTDGIFTPTRGFVFRADLEHAHGYTLSDFAYTRFHGEASAYTGEAGGIVLATRLRGGIGWPHSGGEGSADLGLNPQKRFFAGGPNSVRGFDQYRLGPTVLGIDAVPYLLRQDDPTTAGVEGAGCTAEEVNSLTCDVSAMAREEPGRFDERPAGGEVLLEGNVELRFPLPFGSGRIRGAAFVDAGQVWSTREDVALGEIVATPGLGLRYYSPVGPIRVDAAFNPRGPRMLRVLTTEVEPCALGQPGCESFGGQPTTGLRNTDRVAPLNRTVAFGQGLGETDSVGAFLRRFNLQFSIGQAF